VVSLRVRALVRARAGRRCEYCGAPEEVTGSRYLVDHIFPKALGGGDQLENLAFACSTCNLAKSSHVSGVDPDTGQAEERSLIRARTGGANILPSYPQRGNCAAKRPEAGRPSLD
jgi:5-methylcytosine-specific restriction endonuclease McrA